MAIPIIGFYVEITPLGGFIKVYTPSGDFQFGPTNNYSYINAIATTLQGPNPTYDDHYKAVSCSAGRATTDQPINV